MSSSIPLARVKSVHFCMQSSDQIRKQSVCRVFNPEAIDRIKQIPNSHGVLDLKMGTTDKRFDCSTCGNDHINCNGHFGHIELLAPFYSSSFIHRTYALLRSVCYFCSRLLVGRDDFRAFQVMQDKDTGGLVSRNIFSGISKAAKTKRCCPYEDCGMVQPKYDLDKMVITAKWEPVDYSILIEKGWRHIIDRPFTPKDAQLILDNVDPQDYVFLGLDPYESHPSWAIQTAFPVIPPTARSTDSIKRGQDDLTILLDHIVAGVHNLQDNLKKTLPSWVPLTWKSLQEWIQKYKPLLEYHSQQTNVKKIVNGNPAMAWAFPIALTHEEVAAKAHAAQEAAKREEELNANKPKKRGRKSLKNLINVSNSEASMAASVFVPFKVLVAAGPRDGCAEDILRLLPFVLWVYGILGEDANVVGEIQCLRQAMIDPNDEIVAWLWETYPRPCLEIQCHLTVIVNNDGRSVPAILQHSGSQFKSIVARLNTKTGRIRGHLMGKRIDFTARSVISPGADLDVNELGVPEVLATILSVPESITVFNKERLKKTVVIGHGKIGGATRVISKDGSVTYLEFINQEKREHLSNEMSLGWVVERHLIDGDIVLFNRQPSLHKMSIMGHKIRLLKNCKSFELPLPVTTCYNADFDGDEMNMHVLQTPEARTEALSLIQVPNYFISPQCHRAIIALVQNALLASYLFTNKDVFLTKEQVLLILDNVKYPLYFGNREFTKECLPRGTILFPKELYTGKQVYSWFIHPDVHYEKDTDPQASSIDDSEFGVRIFHPAEPVVVIKRGEIMAGRICKKTVGATQGSLIDILVRDVSLDSVTYFLSDIQRAMSSYLKIRGFTVGIDDCCVSEKISKGVRKVLETLHDLPQVSEKVVDNDEEYLLKKSTSGIADAANRLVMSELLEKPRNKENAFMAMISSGSKGKLANIQSVMTCVGQQLACGHRIRRSEAQGFAPYFRSVDRNPMTNGFINHSYFEGLSAREMYDHFMGGREGLVDTAVKTADTGYTQRRLVKMMENIRVDTDMTVREGESIVQFSYGGTGTNPARYEWVSSKIKPSTSEEFMEMFLRPIGHLFDEYSADAIVAFGNNWVQVSELVSRTAQNMMDDAPKKFLTPVHWDRILERAVYKQEHEIIALAEKMFELDTVWPYDIVGVLRMVNEMNDNLVKDVGPTETSITRMLMFEKMYMFIEKNIQTPDVIVRSWPFIYMEAKRQWIESRCNAGDMMGIIAAQSIGEPNSQSVLNTSHLAGKGSDDLLAGVPRMKEIIDMSEHMTSPSMTLFPLENGHDFSKLVGVSLQSMVHSFSIQKEFVGKPNAKDAAWMSIVEHCFGKEVDTDIDAHRAGWVKESDLKERLVDSSIRYVCRVIVKKNETVPITVVAARLRDFWTGMAENVWDSIQVCYTPTLEDHGFYVVRIRAGGIRIFETEHAEGNKKYAQRYLGIHLRKIMQRAIKTVTFGIDGIKNVRVTEDKFVDAQRDVKTFPTIHTRGSCLSSVASVPFLDWYKSLTNNIPEIYRELGIGAARNMLIRELTKVLSGDGAYILFTHIWMLVDVLTFRGFPMRASRHGQNRVNTGVLQRCSFEESAYILIDGAYFSERDYLKGLTPNLMMGQISPIGTGVCGLKVNKVSSSSDSYFRDSMEYIAKKNSLTPRPERIRDGKEVEYRKRILPQKEAESVKMSLFLKNGGDLTQSQVLGEYWKNNVSADNVIKNNATTSYIRTDAQTASVVTNLITGPKPLANIGAKRVRFS